jgi:hypothetical protein|tara:strand:- start:1320 stop:1955 length:636 start_codon:yes stop_codon:yes gene_type:complete
MTRVIYCEQGSPEWLDSRCGQITASNFKSLFTSRGAKVAASTRDSYLNAVIAEKMCGHPAESFKSYDMERGNLLESQARACFEMHLGVDVKEVGYHMHDEFDIGCSPDGLFADTGVELKCPKANTHIKYLRSPTKLPTEYVQQVHGSMWVLNLSKYYFCSYHPELKPLIIEVKRDEELMEAAGEILISAAKLVITETEKLNDQQICHINER